MATNIARRSICVAATRAPMVPTTLNFIKPVAAGFSTQTHAQVEAVEGMLANLHWADLKDNVHGLRDLMNERKTNKAVASPDSAMENKLAQEMNQIQGMLANPEARREVDWRICRVKALLKEHMYYA